ncbi:MAG TPA: hypothetical protein VMX75_11455 [Spirochaetia bacterium]|nr:hypothetical protein [Spirochaetia bacterium]
MKKNLAATAFLCILTASVPGQAIKFNPGSDLEFGYFIEELHTLVEQKGDQQFGSLTLGELNGIAENLSISIQKTLFIERTRRASWLFPGAGHFMNNEGLYGALFVSANVAITAGTLITAYLLLPEDLHFNNLNPFTDSFTQINNRWNGHSFVDYLPAIGTLAGGVVLEVILRVLAANHAEELAKRNIESGKVEFKPYTFIRLPSRDRHW